MLSTNIQEEEEDGDDDDDDDDDARDSVNINLDNDDGDDDDENVHNYEENAGNMSPRKSPIQTRPGGTAASGSNSNNSPRTSPVTSPTISPRKSPIRAASAPRPSASYRVVKKPPPPPISRKLSRKSSSESNTSATSSSSSSRIALQTLPPHQNGSGSFQASNQDDDDVDVDLDEFKLGDTHQQQQQQRKVIKGRSLDYNLDEELSKHPFSPLSCGGLVLDHIQDNSGGISDEEINKAYDDLKAIIEGKQERPQGMKLLNQGK
jgi:hypothetical protein